MSSRAGAMGWVLLLSGCVARPGAPPAQGNLPTPSSRAMIASRAPLGSVAAAPSQDTASSPPITPALDFVVRGASRDYDFRFVLPNGCRGTFPGSPICEGAAKLFILPQPGPRAAQQISLDNVCVVREPSGEVLVNSVPLYDYQGTVVVGDYDFDGRDDFAVQVSENGPYGGPTFSIFLQSPRSGEFVWSKALSRITEESLGLFQVDQKRKRLVASSKSGCCLHALEEYAMVRDEPVLVARRVQDAMSDPDFVLETDERWIQGKWHKRTRRFPRAMEDGGS